MLISTKELREYLLNLDIKVKCKDSSEEFEKGMNVIITQILKDIAGWESKQLQDLGEPPSGLGVDQEKALVVYCGQKLYAFVEKFSVNTEEDLNIITVGKIYLEVKKALREGKFKRV
jgi:hypothetical protein